MTNNIPTIEELLGLPKRELHAIFRKASAVANSAAQTTTAKEAIAADKQCSTTVQAAAARTVVNVMRCLGQIRRP